MSFEYASARPAAPRPSSFLASLTDSPRPPAPSGVPNVVHDTYDLFLNPVVPITFGLVYFVVAKTLSHYQDGKNRIRGKGWDTVVLLHNIILAVYSAWTFLGTAPHVFGEFWRGFADNGVAGLTHAFCDSDSSVWSSTFSKYSYLFYLSKYWEVLDTAILLLKGKKVGMLQSYHHMGAIWTMYAAYVTQAMPVWIFCVANSLVHSIMYSYYACTAVSIPFPRFLKKSITRMQITQFLVGGSLAASYLFIKLPEVPGSGSAAEKARQHLSSASSSFEAGVNAFRQDPATCLRNVGQINAVKLNVAYLIPLTYLFVAFFVRTYRKNGNAAAAAKKASTKAAKAQ
ncbi:hypothetical protein RHOSPDRAFT_27829 [Rhodotorula sp. JG-1b]|nr:hypothetical protein RHOSPDRAFT_27829 [Rhodotorula sp. JG-1b]